MELVLNTYGTSLNRDNEGFVINHKDGQQRIPAAGMSGAAPPNRPVPDDIDELPSLEERTKKILGLVNQPKKRVGRMLFFVMYDIESNKVRRYVVKYLERQGCTRIQKSIFLADLEIAKFNQIKSDLTEVQAAYENCDSILVVPITTEYLRAMKIIGQNISIDVITHSCNTLFF